MHSFLLFPLIGPYPCSMIACAFLRLYSDTWRPSSQVGTLGHPCTCTSLPGSSPLNWGIGRPSQGPRTTEIGFPVSLPVVLRCLLSGQPRHKATADSRQHHTRMNLPNCGNMHKASTFPRVLFHQAASREPLEPLED